MATPDPVGETLGLVPSRFRRSADGVTRACVAVAAAAMAVGIAGHALDERPLTTFGTDSRPLAVYTVLVVGLLCVSVWCAPSPTRGRRWCSVVAALAAAALSAGALAVHLVPTDLGLGLHPGGRADEARHVVSAQGAGALLLVALACVVVRRWGRLAQAFAVAGLTVAAASAMATAFGARAFLGMSGVPAMSLPGAVAVASLSVGTIAIRTDVGLGRLVAMPTRGGQLARRGLVVAVTVSVALGVGVLLAHERYRVIGADGAASVYALASLFIALGLVVWQSVWVDRVDQARAAATQDLVASEARARELIEHAPEAIVVLDVERGQFVRVNKEAERLFGLPAHELLKRGPLEVSVPVQPSGLSSGEALAEQLERALAGEVPVFEWTLATPTGQPIDAELRLLRLPDRGRILVRGSIVDVSARKQAESAVRAVEVERAARAAAEADRDRIAALQRITARLLAAPSVDDVAAAFVQQVVPDLGATTGLIYTLTDGGLLRRGNTPDAGDPDWLSIEPDAPTTSAAAVRTRMPVVIVGDADAEAEYPMLANAMRELGYEAFASLPLFAGAELVGVASFGFARTPSDDHWHFLTRVAERVGQALERAQLYEAEQRARRELEYAAERAAAMQRVTQALSRAMTTDEIVNLTATLGIEALGAQAATAGLLDPEGNEYVVRTFGLPPGREPWSSRFDADRRLPGPEAVRLQRPLWFTSAQEMAEAFPETGAFLEHSGFGATACVPLIAWGHPLGFLAAHYREDRVFTQVDRVVFTTLASVSGQALERARRYETERETASVLQQSMLPARLPDPPNVTIGARYSSAGELEVGGDWYDAVALEDGSIVVMVGDVVGRGLKAAAAMGQLRSAASALSLATLHPSDVLAKLDVYAGGLDDARLATMVVARLEPATQTLTYASAGHVPGVLLQPDGTARLLEAPGSVPLDAVAEPRRGELQVDFPPGSTLVLYSDGLIERRGESLDVGLRRITRTVSELHHRDVDAMCDRLMEALLPRAPQRDDVAVLCLRLEPGTAPLKRCFPAAPGELAPLRHALETWLSDAGVTPQRAADLVLAIDEACANAVEHAYDHDQVGNVIVEVARVPEREVVVASVRDGGQWRPERHRPDRGRGLSIIRAVVDDCEIQTDASGTTVLLEQRIAPN